VCSPWVFTVGSVGSLANGGGLVVLRFAGETVTRSVMRMRLRFGDAISVGLALRLRIDFGVYVL
jgi:hypothetical protein